MYLDLTGGGQDNAELQQPGSLDQVPPRRSVLSSTTHAVGQAWMYITDEAAAVAAEGPEGLDKAAQHQLPMPKPHLQFNITSEGHITPYICLTCLCSFYDMSNFLIAC